MPKGKRKVDHAVQSWTISVPERVPLVLHWWWLDGACRGESNRALLDLHQAHYVVTDLNELRELFTWHADPLGRWRHVDYVAAPCTHCGAVPPAQWTPTNRRQLSYTPEVLHDFAPSALINYAPGTSRPTLEQLNG